MAAAMWTQGYLSGGDMALHYWQSSAAAAPAALPLLVFLHAFFFDAAFMVTFLQPFTSSFRVVLPDARGHGLSNPLTLGSFNMENLVEDAAAVIRHVSPGEPVLLVGHSMGGSTAARVAQLYPELVKALLLVEPPWNRPPNAAANCSGYITEEQKLDLELVCGQISTLRSLSLAEFALLDTDRETLVPPAQTGLESNRLFDVDHTTIGELRAADIEITMAVGNISMPVMLQVGDPATAVSPLGTKMNPRVAEQMAASYPKGRLLPFKNGRHFLFDDPTGAEWTRASLDFLLGFVSSAAALSADL